MQEYGHGTKVTVEELKRSHKSQQAMFTKAKTQRRQAWFYCGRKGCTISPSLYRGI